MATTTGASDQSRADSGPVALDGALGQGVRASLGKQGLPLFIEPEPGALADHDTFIAWLHEHCATLDDLILKYGGIVLRGFPVATTDHFDAVIDAFPPYSIGYLGGITPRRTVGKKALESTYLAGNYKIGIHQEMAYTRDYPPRIMFFSRKVADEGGETIIGDMRKVTRRLPPALAEKLERLGMCSVRNFGPAGADPARAAIEPEYLSWAVSFGTDDPAEVERLCREIGREAHWNAGGGLTTIARFPAFSVHPVTGEKVYRNTLHAPPSPFGDDLSPEMEAFRAAQFKPSGNYLGDGNRIDEHDRMILVDLVDEATVCWPWQAGDVMILDNLLVGHGRNTFKGERDTQVALLA